ncbi:MAG: DNA repair protein RecO [Burkholderiaceae bacterium]
MNLADAPLAVAPSALLTDADNAASAKLSAEPAYVLHAWPWRESSLIVEFFTRAHGRVVAVAKGARRPRSLVRGLLEPFSPLLVSASGKGEVKTLGKVEWLPGQMPLSGLAMLSGYYASELVLAVFARYDPHPPAFDAYVQCLAALAHGNSDAALRRFEYALLSASGLAPSFSHDSAGNALQSEREYQLVEGQGWVAVTKPSQDQLSAKGAVLLKVAAGNFDEAAARSGVRLLLRALLQRAAHGAPRAVGHRSRQAWLEYSALIES